MIRPIDTRHAERLVTGTVKQFPYAAAQALNGTMYEAQARLQKELDRHFIVRRRQFLATSIKVKRATKETLSGAIGVPPRPRSGISEILALEEFGGERGGLTTGKRIIPRSGARPTPTDVTPPSKWPKKLRSRFVVTTPGGAELILNRTGRRKKRRPYGPHPATPVRVPGQKRQDPNLKVMYRLEDRIEIKPHWNFVDTVKATAREILKPRFNSELAKAIRGART